MLAPRPGACPGRMTLFEWYLARASGIVAFVLLTIAVVLGLTLSGRAKLRYWPRFAVEDVHRFAGLLTGTFISLHVLTLLVDSYLPFSPAQLVVPGDSAYRPLSTALGVVAAELLVALAIANRYRKRLSYRFWRRAHYLNFAVWGLALFHGIFAGTDRVALWADVLYGCSAAAVAGFVAWRATGSGLRPPAATPANTV
jgi:methionine sulfoxide reductase heme-binding subunit